MKTLLVWKFVSEGDVAKIGLRIITLSQERHFRESHLLNASNLNYTYSGTVI